MNNRIACSVVVSAMSGVALCVATASSPLYTESLVLDFQAGESWFGGITSVGSAMPWTAATKGFSRDLRKSNYANQSSPLLLSDKGRWVWCDDPFSFTFDKGRLAVKTSEKAPIYTGTADGGTLRSACLAMMKAHFPPEGKIACPISCRSQNECGYSVLLVVRCSLV